MDEEWPAAELFDEDYLAFYLPRINDGTSDVEAQMIWELLDLQGGSNVLDLACGHGRISNRLAAKGALVTGLDATPLFLEIARHDAADRQLPVEYVHGDMREIPWRERFDAVVSWFTAYGYFDDEQNRRVLRDVHSALRPGGRFLVELNHKDGAPPDVASGFRCPRRRRADAGRARVGSDHGALKQLAHDHPGRQRPASLLLHAAL